MVFRCPGYLLDIVKRVMVRNGDLSLIGDYIVAGLGGGFDVLPELIEDARDVTGYARTIRVYTGFYRDAKVTVIAMGAGPSYAEWLVALAYMKRARALIGVGWCGALQHYVGVGDAVIPIASMRDEDASAHYADPGFPAVADPHLVMLAAEAAKPRVEVLGSRLWLGVVVSTSAMLAETRERVEYWRRHRVLCVDEETSTLYTLAYLAAIPAATLLAVSDHVAQERGPGFETEEAEKVGRVYRELAETALEIVARLHRTGGMATRKC